LGIKASMGPGASVYTHCVALHDRACTACCWYAPCALPYATNCVSTTHRHRLGCNSRFQRTRSSAIAIYRSASARVEGQPQRL
jgi:hypothetical protein